MVGNVMLFGGSILVTLWGVAHIVPTKPVVSGFGQLSAENRRILTMEWVAEGMTLVFLGTLCFLVTLLAGPSTPAAILVYRVSAAMLLVMAIWTAVTAGRTSIVQFKICPVVKTGAALLLLIGSAM